MKPSVGRIVMHRGIESNGSTAHPAIITHVWSDECVNLTVFPDYGPPTLRTSECELDPTSDAPNHGWYWPPRVEG